LDKAGDLLKPAPPPAKLQKSVLAAVRPISGEGTPFTFSMSGFTVLSGVNFFFFGSFVGFTFGSVVPASADQDLFLPLFVPAGPTAPACVLPGALLALVSFSIPLPFVPVFQAFGFTTGVCANFTAFGA